MCFVRLPSLSQKNEHPFFKGLSPPAPCCPKNPFPRARTCISGCRTWSSALSVPRDGSLLNCSNTSQHTSNTRPQRHSLAPTPTKMKDVVQNTRQREENIAMRRPSYSCETHHRRCLMHLSPSSASTPVQSQQSFL